MAELDEILISMAEQVDQIASALKDNAGNMPKKDALELADIIAKHAGNLKKLAKMV